MTDRTPPHDSADDGARPDDEIVSAVLDGDASPDEVARVESSAELRARLAEFSAVRDQVRAVDTPPASLVDGQLAAALDEFSTIDEVLSRPAPAGEADDAGAITPLAEVRRPWWQRAPLGAVAAVLAVIALIGVVSLGTSSDDSADTAADALESSAGTVADGDLDAAGRDTTAAALPADDALAESAPSADALGSADDSADADESFEARPAFPSAEALADYLREELARAEEDGGEAATTTTLHAARDADPCEAVELLGLDPVTVRSVVSVFVDGSPVTAVVHGTDEDQLRLVLVDETTCQAQEDRPL